MDAGIYDGIDRDVCERAVYDIHAMALPSIPHWHPGRGHIADHTTFPELVALFTELFGLPEPEKQMGIMDPPGCRGILPHGHDSDAVLFYPRTHPIPLCLDPPYWIDVKSGRVVFVPRKLRHSVMPNTTSVDRYCVAMLWPA